ncbi:MAG: hypothetical protein RL670_687, partial [Actinomycetota bacterium]
SADHFNPFDRKPLPGDVRRGEVVRPALRSHRRGANLVQRIKTEQAKRADKEAPKD